MNNRIVIFGQFRTGTTALFTRIKNSLPEDSVHYLFEPQTYSPPPDNTFHSTLAKVILDVNTDVDYSEYLLFDKQIYLIRDPRDWLISSLLFILQQDQRFYKNIDTLKILLELVESKEQDPKSMTMIDFISQIFQLNGLDIHRVLNNVINKRYEWLKYFEAELLKDYITVRYEDIIDDKVDNLENYLGFPIIRGDVSVSFGHVARTKGYGNWRDWFLEEDCQVFRPIFAPYLERHGYTLNWDLNDTPVIAREHCSYYVRRVVQQRIENEIIKLQNTISFLKEKEQETMGTFTTHAYTEGDEIEINDGFNQIFGLNRPLSDWNWKFAPVYEKSWIIIARDDERKLIAQYAVIHQAMQVDGKQIHAGQPVDVYRIKRPSTSDQMVFTQTVLKFFDTFCAADKLVFLFGFPGKRALHVGQTRLGYGEAVPIHIWHKVVPKPNWIDSRRKVTSISIEDADLSQINDLWLRSKHRYPFSLIRDKKRLERRFIEYPGRDYIYIPIESNNQLRAWAILRVIDDVLQWIDLVWDGQDLNDLVQLEKRIILLAQSTEIERIEMWILGDQELIGFLQENNWIKAVDPYVHLVGRAWHPDYDAQELIKQMYVTLGDSDLV